MEAVNYPNDCVHPRVLKCETSEPFEWTDDHPLNKRGWEAHVAEMFGRKGSNR
jgi:hypothetical protein